MLAGECCEGLVVGVVIDEESFFAVEDGGILGVGVVAVGDGLGGEVDLGAGVKLGMGIGVEVGVVEIGDGGFVEVEFDSGTGGVGREERSALVLVGLENGV